MNCFCWLFLLIFIGWNCSAPPDVYPPNSDGFWAELIASNDASTLDGAYRSYACVHGTAHWSQLWWQWVGWQLISWDSVWSRTINVTCVGGVGWSAEDGVTCETVQCSTPPNLPFSDVTTTGSDFVFSEAVYYECHEGYVTCDNSSSFMSVCSEFALWSVTSQQCYRKLILRLY